LPTLYPVNFLATVLQSLSGLGAAVALTFGATSLGGEYSWGTLKSVLTQRPSRLQILAGKALALGVILLAVVVLTFFVGGICSYCIYRASETANTTAEWPSAVRSAKALMAGWLILATSASIGIFLAALFRSSALATGLGLVYLLILDSSVRGISMLNETVNAIGKIFPGRNAADLASAFAPSIAGAPTMSADVGAIEPSRAALTLGAYMIGLLFLTALLFRRRDMTS
jgi:ABC-type transport system involved in multi-copper enzyme maturation permease subunit